MVLSFFLAASIQANPISPAPPQTGAAYLDSSTADLASAVKGVGKTPTTLVLGPGAWPIAATLTIPPNVNLKPMRGAVFAVATGVALTLNGGLEAGPYQIFSCAGTGKVMLGLGAVREVLPEWWGAKGDDSTDDTPALNLAHIACPTGGVIYLTPGKIYKTTGWLLTKTLSLVTDAPASSYIGIASSAIKAAGSQSYVVKFLGTHSNDSSGYLRPYIRNLAFDGGSTGGATLSDAALVMETCFYPIVDNFTVQDASGRGIRLRNVLEGRFSNFFILNCGTINTGSAWFIDGPTPFNADYLCNNISIFGGTWSANRGRWIDVSPLAGMDCLWIENNKFEFDSALGIPNTADTDVIHLGAASRTWIINNTFANLGMTSDKYQNLIYINGDPCKTSPGAPDVVISGNSAANLSGIGAINGLYLDTYAPTVVEKDNVFRSGDTTICANVNVSQYPQLINKFWRNVSGSLYPMIMPSIEWPGYVSEHRLTRGTSLAPFVADANCVNDAGTVLKLTTANKSLPEICSLQDLSRWVGYNATNLVLRIRMRLDAPGNVTVKGVPNFPAYDPIDVTVSSTSWAWYSFTFPLANITQTNHYLNVYLWSINSGTLSLLVDGIEFSTN